MLRDIGQDALANIAEYTLVGREKDINLLRISDSTLVSRIKQYNRDFSYEQWQKDLKEKSGYLDLMGDKYMNRVGIFQHKISKPDNIANILSTPDTLEEYLNRLVSYNNHPYRKYFELLTGNGA